MKYIDNYENLAVRLFKAKLECIPFWDLQGGFHAKFFIFIYRFCKVFTSNILKFKHLFSISSNCCILLFLFPLYMLKFREIRNPHWACHALQTSFRFSQCLWSTAHLATLGFGLLLISCNSQLRTARTRVLGGTVHMD